MSNPDQQPVFPKRSTLARAGTALCLLVFSILEYRLLNLVHQSTLQAHLDVMTGILDGHPYWKAYQNRLLGPWLVMGIARMASLSPATAIQVFQFATLCLANGVAFVLFARRGRDMVQAWRFVAIYAGLFVAFQDADWLYLWDYVDLTTMLLFAWAVVVGRWTSWQLAVLCLIELLNRESAQFIALWMLIDSLQFDWKSQGWRRVRIDFPRLLAGVLLGVICVWWTGYIRDKLCLGETGVIPRANIRELASGQFYMLPVTLDLILHESLNLNAAALLIFLGGLGWLLRRAWTSLGQRAWKVGLLLVIMVAANACFAFLYELRVWFTLLPFLPCLIYVWRHGRGGENENAV